MSDREAIIPAGMEAVYRDIHADHGSRCGDG